MSRSLTTLLLVTILFSAPLRADERTAPAQTSGFKPIWTAVGAGAGFGLGVYVGLAKFDDALYSDRKVWTTAIVSAAAGGVIGFLIDRRRARAGRASRTSGASQAGRAGRAGQVAGIDAPIPFRFRLTLPAPPAPLADPAPLARVAPLAP